MNKVGEVEVQYVLQLLYPNDIFCASECPDIKQRSRHGVVPYSGIEVVSSSVFGRDKLMEMWRYDKENHPTTQQFMNKFGTIGMYDESWCINILRCIVGKILLIRQPHYTSYNKMSIACIASDFTHDISSCDDLHNLRRHGQKNISKFLTPYLAALCELYNVDKIYLIFINDAFLNALDREYALHELHWEVHGYVYTYDKIGIISYMSRKF